MKGSHFIFDSVQPIYQKCHKVSFKCGGSYINSLGQIKKQKSNNKSKNEDNKFFHYAVTVALNYEQIEPPPERVSNIKLFINKYNWEKINCP